MSHAEFVQSLLNKAVERVNNGVSKTLTARRSSETPPLDPRHLTDTRTRVSTLLEYSLAYEMNHLLAEEGRGFSVSSVLWNVFPDLVVRDASRNPTIGLEVKALHMRRNPILTATLMARYPACEIGAYYAIMRSARILDVRIDAAGTLRIAQRARGTPRIANRLLRRVRDYAEVRAAGHIDAEVAKRALDLLEKNPPAWQGHPDYGHLTLACALGYLDFRHEGKWRAKHPRLVAWLDQFAKAVPAFEETRPKA
jgi:hypothetical protein